MVYGEAYDLSSGHSMFEMDVKYHLSLLYFTQTHNGPKFLKDVRETWDSTRKLNIVIDHV